MLKIKLQYAEEFLAKGYSGGYRTLSCHDGLLVIQDLESYQNMGYFGSRLSNGKLLPDTHGYVIFNRVQPIIDSNTRFKFP